MFLKKIEIQGFKSFPEKVTLEMDKGVTAVVGPNGSGKSNISDAVKWVLGEQSMKNLRGSRMEDVIFAGTENRKPMGFAEVSLTIDNSTGILPVEYSEVTVTRRVYRSGESEFLINKSQCRLKDISELFMGTGVGKDGYSIIAQGRIDEILSAKSDDRRLIFEEAAGIMKYKVRKIEAERKLEQTRQNLLRIQDIIGELENQLEPLKEQAEVARKYLTLKERLKVLEINVFIENMSKYEIKLEEYKKMIDDLGSEIENEQSSFDQLQDGKKQFHLELEAIENNMEEIRQAISDISNSIEQSNTEIKLARERIENNSLNRERLIREIEEFKQRMEELGSELGHKAARLENLKADRERYSAELLDKEKELSTISESLDSEQEKVESIKTEIIEKMNMASDIRNETGSLRVLLESMERRKGQVDEELEQLIMDSDSEKIKLDEISDSILAIKKEIGTANGEKTRLEQEQKKIESSLSNAGKEIDNLKTQINNKKVRYNLLCDLEKDFEGYSRSVRAVLEECERDGSFRSGIHGALAQLITVPAEYETAIEMVLGPALQHIVTDNEETAKKAIDFLKERKSGRATFLPLSVIKGNEIDDKADKLYLSKGFLGVASALVVFNEKYCGIMKNLLGRTIIVDNLENAIQIARKFRHGFRIVTLDGDVVNTSGSMSGGSSVMKSSGILGRSREIKELSRSISKLEKTCRQKTDAFASSKEGFETILKKIGELNETIMEKEMVAAREEEKVSGITSNLERYKEKAAALNSEREQIDSQRQEILAAIEAKQKSSEELENNTAELEQVVKDLQEKSKQGYAEKDRVYDQITNIRISLSSIDEGIASLEEVSGRIDDETEACNRNISRRTQELNRIAEEKTRLESSIIEHEKQTGELEAGKRAKEEELAGKKKQREEINSSLANTEEQLIDRLKNIELLKNECSRIELKKSRVEMDMEILQNKMWEEYEVTLNSAVEYTKDIGGIQTAQREINSLRSQIKGLGNVNVGAIDEYTKTRERFEFLSSQRNDLEASEEKLRKVISEMTSIMKRQFLEQFNHICRNFEQVFKELFGGGRATLKLADENNILESGIEIEVQPPGKKLQNMMLLSGGEKAFTAIALLFAILKINPSPFCILDEIEAALDEVNVFKFADYVKKFSYDTQFILVTHRKGTMQSADALYGVTMEERGVSKLVSIKMNEKAS